MPALRPAIVRTGHAEPLPPGILGGHCAAMPSPLFSTYSTGENRVTSSTLAVFERIDLALVQELLAAASGVGADMRGVTVENQVVSEGSVPDGRISGHFDWWFETKVVPGEYEGEGHGRSQLRQHAALLRDADALLFVLTPDPAAPAWFATLDGLPRAVRGRVAWLSFRRLADTVDVLLRDPARTLGERTRFLMTELIAFYEAEGLLSADDTVVVAARSAWPEYLSTGAYVCQPDRAFREGLTHLGFYTDGRVQHLVPSIRERHASVLLTSDEAEMRRAGGDRELAAVIDAALEASTRTAGASYGIFLLSPPDAHDTLVLPSPVINDTVTAAGKPWAWVLGHRYTSTKRLKAGPEFTSQL